MTIAIAVTWTQFAVLAVLLIGFIALIAGLATDYPVVILFGVASLIAALGQHWVYRNSPRR